MAYYIVMQHLRDLPCTFFVVCLGVYSVCMLHNSIDSNTLINTQTFVIRALWLTLEHQKQLTHVLLLIHLGLKVLR